MSNLGKAIYMAAFAFLFVIAATTSIYLYGTLNTYLNQTTSNIDMSRRSESTNTNGDSSTIRNIDRSEIYITLFNMEQMHIKSVTVNGKKVTPENVEEYKQSRNSGGNMPAIMTFLNEHPNLYFYYSVDDNNVTYKPR